MNQKRALLFVVLGVLGMGFAVYVMKAASGRGTRSQGTVASVKVLRAIADVSYGQKLIEAGKEGEGQKPNVQFVDWPASFVPEGVVRDEKSFGEKEFVARADFLPGEPIFESQTVPLDQFLSVDMVVRQFTANPIDIRMGRFRPGTRVDIVKVQGGEPKPFMRCVRIYGVGEVGADGLPVKTQDTEYVLLEMKEEHGFVLADALDRGVKFRLRMADGECEEGPELVEETGTFSDAEARKAIEAQRQLARLRESAEQLARAEHYDQALAKLCEANCVSEAVAYREKVMAALCERAQAAFDAGDHDAALAALNELSEMDAAVRRALELRGRIDRARAEQEAQERYTGLLASIEQALATGNLPAAERWIETLDAYRKDGFEPASADVPAPERASEDFRQKLSADKAGYEQAVRVLRAFIDQRRCAKAREKLQDMKKRFPAHPDVSGRWEKEVEGCEGE